MSKSPDKAIMYINTHCPTYVSEDIAEALDDRDDSIRQQAKQATDQQNTINALREALDEASALNIGSVQRQKIWDVLVKTPVQHTSEFEAAFLNRLATEVNDSIHQPHLDNNFKFGLIKFLKNKAQQLKDSKGDKS